MNSRKTLIILVILAVIGGAAFSLAVTGDVKQAKQDMFADQPNQNTASKSADTSAPGTYIDYEEGVVASTPGTKLLFFHAQWCPQCRALEDDIQKNGVPSGVTIIKVDYDSNQQLRQKYGVTLQTTVVKVTDTGELVKKFVAYDNPSLDSVAKNLL